MWNINVSRNNKDFFPNESITRKSIMDMEKKAINYIKNEIRYKRSREIYCVKEINYEKYKSLENICREDLKLENFEEWLIVFIIVELTYKCNFEEDSKFKLIQTSPTSRVDYMFDSFNTINFNKDEELQIFPVNNKIFKQQYILESINPRVFISNMFQFGFCFYDQSRYKFILYKCLNNKLINDLERLTIDLEANPIDKPPEIVLEGLKNLLKIFNC